MALIEKIEIDEVNRKLKLTMGLEPDGTRSKGGTGPMFLIASTRGNQETAVQYQGKPLFANVNIGQYVDPKE